MSIPKKWMDREMSFVAFSDDEATSWLLQHEKEEQARRGLKREAVRRAIAHEIGIEPGTIENMRRGRLKGLRAKTRDAIQAFFIRQLMTKIQRAENDYKIALQSGVGPSSSQMQQAKTAIAFAMDALKEIRQAEGE